MHKYSLLKYFVKIYDLILFLLFLFLPSLISSIIIKAIIFFTGYYYKINNLIQIFIDEPVLSYLIIYYFILFILYVILKNKMHNKIKVFNNENWFVSLGKAMVPAIIAFGIAIVSLSFISTIINLLPDFFEFKKYLQMQNPALADLLKSVKDKMDFKIIIWLFIIILIAPLCEEILFRGFLQRFTEKIFKAGHFDVISVAVLFGLFHMPSFYNVIYAIIIGIFFSIQRKKYQAVNVTVWMHSLINFASVIFAITYQYLSTS